MRKISRRELFRSSAAATAAFGLGAAPAIARGLTANEKVRVAVIGTGGRGNSLIGGVSGVQQAQLVALCDADEAHVNRAAARLRNGDAGQESKTAAPIDRYTDYRRVLERDDVDAVVIAAPNHWHALLAIHACQHGKHVYVEKPVCHTVWEGRKMVEAMQRYNRIVAAGFQNRSDVGLREAMPLLHDGALGAVQRARGLCYRDRDAIGKRDTPLAPPESLDYGMWLGPAADQPIMRPKLHYDWHWDFNTGNGDMGNQGPHEMDLLRWALGDPRHPQRITSFGGRFGWDDAGDTPNMQCALFDFGDGVPVVFEVRNLHQEKESGVGRYGPGPGVGIIVTCENGEFRGGRGGGAFYDNDGQVIRRFRGDGGRTHMQNFVDAVRNGDGGSLRAPLESSFYSSSMSHLANISVRVGQSVSDESLAAQLSDDEIATETLERFSSQLALWEVDTSKTPWHCGPELTFDDGAERFVAGENKQQANALLRREDRAPYIVPETV